MVDLDLPELASHHEKLHKRSVYIKIQIHSNCGWGYTSNSDSFKIPELVKGCSELTITILSRGGACVLSLSEEKEGIRVLICVLVLSEEKDG